MLVDRVGLGALEDGVRDGVGGAGGTGEGSLATGGGGVGLAGLGRVFTGVSSDLESVEEVSDLAEPSGRPLFLICIMA